MAGHGVAIHLASNPDMAAAMRDPTVDFREGTALTNNVVEAMRRAGVPRILYASGSGVYGDLGSTEIVEDHAPMEPIPTYAASKLAGHALIAASVHIVGMSVLCFRFANVVVTRQTHRVRSDFLPRLLHPPRPLAT